MVVVVMVGVVLTQVFISVFFFLKGTSKFSTLCMI